MTKETPAAILASVKHAIRNRYAWPGGYPLYVVMADGEALSCEAAKENWRAICSATICGSRDGWQAAGADINYEDGDLYCAHSGQRIESAYAEPEGEGV
jgi:hypothetical protein